MTFVLVLGLVGFVAGYGGLWLQARNDKRTDDYLNKSNSEEEHTKECLSTNCVICICSPSLTPISTIK